VHDRLRAGSATLRAGALVASLALLPNLAQAQSSFTWVGSGSTTDDGLYRTGTNWSNPPSGAPPVAAGQSAIFDANGSATVTVNGAAISPNSWTFTAGAQSYTISGAALNFSQAGSVGGLIDNANAGQTITIANTIGETVAGVQVQLTGQSTLVLSGNNSYSGGTTVGNFGTLVVGNNNAVGSGTVTLSAAIFQAEGSGNLTFGNNFNISDTATGNVIDANGVRLTLNGNIGGTGALTVQDSGGGGVVVLNGANTYTGATTVCFCGTLQLGDAGHTASIVGAVTNEGLLKVFNANMSAVTSITNDGGETRFLNATTAAGTTISNQFGGTTVFRDGSAAASANITNLATGGSSLFFNNSSAGNAVITNNSSAGTIVPVGLGFFDNSTAGNAVIVNGNGGLIAFGLPFSLGGSDAPTAGNATITNNAGGRLQFDAFAAAGNATIITNASGAVAFFDRSSGGNGQFITNGSGFVDFSASVGPNGDGRITAGSIAGSGTYIIGPGNTLIVGSNNLSTTVSGTIVDSCGCSPGSGSLVKVGSGMLTLSGVNTYTGTTTVSGGVLDLEGSIASSSMTTVNAGGALTGAGILGNATIASGGIFLPGSGFGTSTTVQGNLAFQSGALYLVQLSSTSSTSARVSGTATLGGNVGVAFAPGSTVMKRYTILTAAGGVSGAFDGVAAPGGLVGTVATDATDAILNFALDYGAKNTLNVNQQNVASTLANFFNANGGISAVFTSLTPSGLTQASGEVATGSQAATFEAMNLFLGLLTDPFIDGRSSGAATGGGAQGYVDEDSTLAYAARKPGAARAFANIPTKAAAARNAPFDNRWSVWGAAYGGGANSDGNAALGSNAATTRAFGFAAGADYRISPSLLAGFALAGGGTNFAVTGFGGGRSDLFQAGAFVRGNLGAAFVTAAAAYGWQDITTDRTVTIAGVDHLRAEFNANAWSGRLEGGYRFATPWMGLTPYAAGQFTIFSLPAYAEQVVAGTGNFALNYAAKDVTAARTELGVRTDRSFAMQNGVLTLRGRFAWAHDFNTDRNVTAVFQTLPGASFIVNGAAQAHESALTTVSAEMGWLNGWSAAATFEGEFSGISQSYAGKGVMRYNW
jgi:autotransporter-associated beta strand protein